MDFEILFLFYSAFAQAESESISMNIKLGYKAKMKCSASCGILTVMTLLGENKQFKFIDSPKEEWLLDTINYYMNKDKEKEMSEKRK